MKFYKKIFLREEKEAARLKGKSSDYQNAPPTMLLTKISFERYTNVQIYLLF